MVVGVCVRVHRPPACKPVAPPPPPLACSVSHGQIALRFPGAMCAGGDAAAAAATFTPAPWWSRTWHIDGLPGPRHARGIRHFTCLVGVYLEDVTIDFAGNLVVYPGGHALVEDHFREAGIEGVAERGNAAFPQLPLPPPVQLAARAGDVVVAHYCLPHSIAPNTSDRIRYAVYFRASSVALRADDFSPLLDIWAQVHSRRAPCCSAVVVDDDYAAAAAADACVAFILHASRLAGCIGCGC